MSHRQVHDLFGRSIDRRRLLQGGAALGVAAASGLKLSPNYTLAQDVTTLKFYHDKAGWQDYFVEQGNLAEAAIGVNWEPSPYADTTSYQAAVLAALPTGETPDFFTWWSGYRIEDLYNQDVLVDLSDVWTQAVADGNLPESLGAAFAFDGKQWAIPSHVSYWVVFYNKKLFADNGLSVPTTWDEFIAVCDGLKAAGVSAIASTQNGRWPSFIMFEELVLRTDPQFYLDLTAGRAKYTDPTAVQAMDTWRTMIEAEYFTSFDLDMGTEFQLSSKRAKSAWCRSAPGSRAHSWPRTWFLVRTSTPSSCRTSIRQLRTRSLLSKQARWRLPIKARRSTRRRSWQTGGSPRTPKPPGRITSVMRRPIRKRRAKTLS
jgi:hypothetical protein